MLLAIRSRCCGAVLISISIAVPVKSAFAQVDVPGEYRQLVPGLLSRSIFKGDAGGRTVEVIDLLVGARKASEELTAPGRAMLDVQAGDATLIVDGKPQQVRPGAVIPLDHDRRITIDNTGGERPFVARMIVFSSARR
ncbi:hypothetical protein [Bradyrhizobium sp. LMG 9283]|uniref:hypothetical protein n=1 Tax=Bradyrhizobium sp. LMG 9283 TaxID=592064 RepID=UPI00388E03B6